MEKTESNLTKYDINIDQYNEKDKPNIIKYIESLEEIECKAMKIAQDHLETSFHITKSIGFRKWLKNNM
jgi:hypothetical protein